MNSKFNVVVVCCAISICATSAYSQGWSDTCAHLKEWKYVNIQPGDAQLAKEKYDTLKLFIKQCATSDTDSYQVFNSISGAVQLYSTDTTRFEVYREWLISVLDLNKSVPAYFCACLGAIVGTYQYGRYRELAGLAIMDYTRKKHSECWGEQAEVQYIDDSILAFQDGLDPTHLPSLDSLGLGFLLNHSGVPSTSMNLSSQDLASFGSSPNPFVKETTLQFTLNRMTYATIEVYDELGSRVWGAGKGLSLDAGTHSITIDGKNLPIGTLYARISTGFGEVKTVKLIHE
ncbi:MAG: hypothetical protein Q8916_00020 [Bacteroidota bacterium]|nr:hypothetical protein [Bacteroidota bacterium]MDP4228771.1 hypothetical protein [Bacteroidota bacterium]MDP4236036.1 hypothetical protein [Bacteroidota bacterium]